MNKEELIQSLYTMNEDEKFYESYYNAKKNNDTFQFLSTVTTSYILEKRYIIPEIIESIPPHYEDSFFFNLDSKECICIQKHNCYSPSILHQHTFFELIYIIEGTCKQFINNVPIEMKTGDFCLIPPNVSHTISVFDNSVVVNVLIRKSTFEDIFFNFIRSDNILSDFFINNIYSKHVNDYIIFHSGKDQVIRNTILSMFLEYVNKEKYFEEILNNQLMNLFALLLRHYESTSELPPITHKRDIQGFALIRFIQDNYMNVTLDQIALKFHYTPEYTSKLIKETTGYTLTQILQRVRMNRAQALLSDTNISVNNIATEVGYQNIEHFIRTFKKEFQMTPTEFRKKKILPS